MKYFTIDVCKCFSNEFNHLLLVCKDVLYTNMQFAPPLACIGKHKEMFKLFYINFSIGFKFLEMFFPGN